MVFLLEQSIQTKTWTKGVFTTLYFIYNYFSPTSFNYGLHHLPKQRIFLCHI